MILRGGSNVRYLTGFTGSHGVLCGDAQGWCLVTDSRYTAMAESQAPGLEVVIDRASFARSCALLRERGVEELIVEESLAAIDYVGAVGLFSSVMLESAPMAALRAVKSESEQAFIEQACGMTARALAHVASRVRTGMSEREISRMLEERFRAEGADGAAFETIVASGENSAIPHHRPSDRQLATGDLLVIDCGAQVAGYRADMTRTYIVGTAPADWQVEMHAAVLDAQGAGLAALRPGRDAAEMDDVVRSRLTERGLEASFSHGTGHGVGLDIHEWPLLVPGGAGTISAGMTLTVEPGLYLAGRGGVRIEDTVVVTDKAPRILTESSRALARVG